MKSSDVINPKAHLDCEGCPVVPERREFLRSAAAFAVAAISLGLPIRSVSAKVLASAVGGRQTLSYPLPAADGAQIASRSGAMLRTTSSSIRTRSTKAMRTRPSGKPPW